MVSSSCSKGLRAASSLNNEVPTLKSTICKVRNQAIGFSFLEISLFERILCESSILPIHLSKLGNSDKLNF